MAQERIIIKGDKGSIYFEKDAADDNTYEVSKELKLNSANDGLDFDGSPLVDTGDKGQKGVQGAQGTQGVQGVKGQKGAGGGGGGSSLTVGSDNQIPFTNGAGDDLEYAADFTFDGTTFNVGSGSGGSEYLTVNGSRSTIILGSSAASNFGVAYKIYENGGTTLQTGSDTDQQVASQVVPEMDPFTGQVIGINVTYMDMNHAGGIYIGSTSV